MSKKFGPNQFFSLFSNSLCKLHKKLESKHVRPTNINKNSRKIRFCNKKFCRNGFKLFSQVKYNLIENYVDFVTISSVNIDKFLIQRVQPCSVCLKFIIDTSWDKKLQLKPIFLENTLVLNKHLLSISENLATSTRYVFLRVITHTLV